MKKIRSQRKIFGVFSIFMAVIAVLSSLYLFNTDVIAQGQETCPDGGDWIKLDVNALSYTYEAPEG